MPEFPVADLTQDLNSYPLNNLSERTHATAVSKGFYEMPELGYLLNSLSLMITISDTIDLLTAQRKGIEVPEGIQVADLDDEHLLYAQKLLLIVSEVVEAFHELAAGNELEEAFEVADIAIRLFDYAAARNIDLDAVVNEKMAQRPHKHGARF